jgi:hypothetical protein
MFQSVQMRGRAKHLSAQAALRKESNMDLTKAVELVTRICDSVTVNWQDQQAIREALRVIGEALLAKKE